MKREEWWTSEERWDGASSGIYYMFLYYYSLHYAALRNTILHYTTLPYTSDNTIVEERVRGQLEFGQ